MFNMDEETKGEGDKENTGDDGNTGNGGASDIDRMNQQREYDQDQGDYEEPAEDEVTEQVQMMWQTNKETFIEELMEIPEPQMEDQNIKRFWSCLETQGTKDMGPSEAIMSLATGETSQ